MKPVHIPALQKYCAACETVKTKAAFYRNKHTQDGLQVYCKTCHADMLTGWRERKKAERAAELAAMPPEKPKPLKPKRMYVRRVDGSNPTLAALAKMPVRARKGAM